MLALIIDLDNTIYPVASTSGTLFKLMFDLIAKAEFELSKETIETAKKDIQRTPFHKVATMHNFPVELARQGSELLRNMEYKGGMDVYDDYSYIKSLPARRFLLTAGYTRLQMSKLACLGITDDFEEIFIVDPDFTSETKKEVIQRIIDKYQLRKEDIIVIGDDLESEIKGGRELGLKTFLMDAANRYPDEPDESKGTKLSEVAKVL
ncbi:MAG: HAD family hydrolase [Daejeonella sp.]